MLRRRTLVWLVAVATAAFACSDSEPRSSERSTTTTTRATSSTTAVPTTALVEAAISPVGAVTHGTLDVGGRARAYRLYVPRRLPQGPVPLFVALHGGTGWADQFARTNHVEGLAESNGFLVVHPDGVKIAGSQGGVWNGGICCGIAARDRVDDVGFVAALVDRLAAEHQIDPARVYAFGHSNGGIMSYRLACELADRIVGVGVVAGTLGVDTCAPSSPVSIMHVHGTADENVPISGGTGPRSLAGVEFPPPRDGFARLARAIGCPTADETNDGDLTITRRQPCEGGAAAVFVTIAGASHAWPGGTPIIEGVAGPTYKRYDATEELVRFLLSHPR